MIEMKSFRGAEGYCVWEMVVAGECYETTNVHIGSGQVVRVVQVVKDFREEDDGGHYLSTVIIFLTHIRVMRGKAGLYPVILTDLLDQLGPATYVFLTWITKGARECEETKLPHRLEEDIVVLVITPKALVDILRPLLGGLHRKYPMFGMEETERPW